MNSSFVVVIDEPENHLHPALQRSLLPDLIKAFPSVQFVVATHNPFMVTSVPDSNVYVLNYNDVQKVESRLLDLVNKAGSSNEVLRDILGVSNTLPIWAQDKVDSIIEKYSNIGISENSIMELRKDMSELGLEHLFPEAITKIVGKKFQNLRNQQYSKKKRLNGLRNIDDLLMGMRMSLKQHNFATGTQRLNQH